MQAHDKIYIDGAWTPSSGSGSIDVYDSTNGEVIATIPAGTADDVDCRPRPPVPRSIPGRRPRARGAGQVPDPRR